MIIKRNRVTEKCNFWGAVLGGGLLAVMFISGFILYTIMVFHGYDGLSENGFLFLKWSFLFSGIFWILTLLLIFIDFIAKKRKKYFILKGISPALYCFKTIGIMVLSFCVFYFIIAALDSVV